MAGYEPKDSRKVTHSKTTAPGEPARTGAREDEAHRMAQERQKELREEEEEEEERRPADDGRLAIANEPGAARPRYDQYELNDADKLDQYRDDEKARRSDDGQPIAAEEEEEEEEKRDPLDGKKPGEGKSGHASYGDNRTKDGKSDKDMARKEK